MQSLSTYTWDLTQRRLSEGDWKLLTSTSWAQDSGSAEKSRLVQVDRITDLVMLNRG